MSAGASVLAAARRAVIKVGSSLVTNEGRGLDSAAIGNLASASGLVLHELATQRASLEEAFMELTHDSVDYRPEQVA